MARQRNWHATGNTASYTMIDIPDEEAWVLRVLAECGTGRKDFADLTTEQQGILFARCNWLLSHT